MTDMIIMIWLMHDWYDAMILLIHDWYITMMIWLMGYDLYNMIDIIAMILFMIDMIWGYF